MFTGTLTASKICSAKRDRKSTRLNSSHEWISYAVFCLKKKKKKQKNNNQDKNTINYKSLIQNAKTTEQIRENNNIQHIIHITDELELTTDISDQPMQY